MKYLVNGKEMKEIDRQSIEEFKIPSLVLMERAALAVADEAAKLAPKGGRVLAACGTGNNGADGIAAARILFLRGMDAVILLPDMEKRGSQEFLVQLEIAEKLGIPIYGSRDFVPGTYDVVIDGIFGIGLSRNVEGVYKNMIELLSFLSQESEKTTVVAVDVPSGISSDTGKIMGCGLKADVTVTFGEQKLGQALFPGKEFCGRLVVADIGFPAAARGNEESYVRCYEYADLRLIPKRAAYSNKGTYGKVLVAAGAVNMAGAAYLSALAAYRCGAGLVKVLTVEENRTVIQELLPEAVLASYRGDWADRCQEDFKDYIKNQLDWADVIVLGPGLGKSSHAKTLVETVLSDAYVPIILDADAVNLTAQNRQFLNYFTENIIITPHLGEMARLTGQTVDEIREDLVGTAKRFTEQYGVTCVLKDAATVISRKDGRLFINSSGSPAMAKGGSGDVLSGTIAGLIAIGMEDCEAASFGAYLHGLAGERAAAALGVHSVLAGELAGCLGEVINETV